MPGAVAYMATLENLNNHSQAMQAATTVHPAYNGFTVIPGNAYRFRVRARCLNLGYGATGEAFYRPIYIVVDMVLDRGDCTPSGDPLATMQFNSPPYINPLLASGNVYTIEFSHQDLPSPTRFSFQYINSKFKFQALGVEPKDKVLEGQIIGNILGAYGSPPMDAAEVRASSPGCH